jgi:hypothetical protein
VWKQTSLPVPPLAAFPSPSRRLLAATLSRSCRARRRSSRTDPVAAASGIFLLFPVYGTELPPLGGAVFGPAGLHACRSPVSGLRSRVFCLIGACSPRSGSSLGAGPPSEGSLPPSGSSLAAELSSERSCLQRAELSSGVRFWRLLRRSGSDLGEPVSDLTLGVERAEAACPHLPLPPLIGFQIFEGEKKVVIIGPVHSVDNPRCRRSESYPPVIHMWVTGV